ncbi:MAG: uncharacterized protein K0R12_821 [Gammaproteobacteria bacterium]|nr:uncharacterized protein [Gammaproteobacteria bacterium]
MNLYFFFKRNSAILVVVLLLIIAGGFFLTHFGFKGESEHTGLQAQSGENSAIIIPTEQMAGITTVNANESTPIPLPENSQAIQPELAATQTALIHLSNEAEASPPSQTAHEAVAPGSTASAAPAAALNTPLPINQTNVVSSATTVTEPVPAAAPKTATSTVDPAQLASQQRSREAAEALLAAINEEAGIQVDLSDQADAKTVAAVSTSPLIDKPQPLKPAAAKTASAKQTLPRSVVIVHPHEQEKTAAVKSLPSKGRYTVQLIGLRSNTEASRFIQTHKLNTAKIVPVKANNRVVYVVVTGDFNSQAAATKAVSNMPASLKKLHPWVRPVSSLEAARVTPTALHSEKKVASNTNASPLVEQESLF